MSFFSCTLARQVWAISDFPHPRDGFDQTSLYANLRYIFTVWRNHEELRWNTGRFPWLLWYLWKNRNSLLFEGVLYDGMQVCKKALDEADVWLSAQEEMVRDEEMESRPQCRQEIGWVVPPRQFVKCNIGMKWSNTKKELGVAWILRNSEGSVLLHSRRSFLRVLTKDKAYYLSLVWAIESMVSLKCQRVYFAIEGGMLVNAINRPKAWPSFKSKVSELRHLLGELLEWSVMKETGDINRDARLIASSVINCDRFQSYVARGYLRWL
ncbi:hypothetical protein BRARA_J00194 [Brassica rapa]|uniref:RNase H type-1 domain-containing protein n=1 Tax=Brassica campestris TaxID=3711 RepID=A0A397XHP2_BRACM|nr:hypothetical protein BRARA_J00194 [Brassica rapa]